MQPPRPASEVLCHIGHVTVEIPAVRSELRQKRAGTFLILPKKIGRLCEADCDLAGATFDCLPYTAVIGKVYMVKCALTKFGFSFPVDVRSAHEVRQVKDDRRTPLQD